MKRIVIAGGTGFLGSCLVDHLREQNELVILTRGKSYEENSIRYVTWDAKTSGDWCKELENADVLINLNGKSVDCRYTDKNKRLIYSSRLDSTAILGKAIQQCKTPPKLWINASSATIYRHSLDMDMDECSGEIGSGFSVDVCQKWEQACTSFETKQTRKILIRTGIVLGKKNGALRPLKALAKSGLGGRQGAGNQYFSWIHENDFARIIDVFIENESMVGVYNVVGPAPVPNNHLMCSIRKAAGIPFGLPLPKFLLEIGAALINTETELILKSRRVVPKRLLEGGFKFQYNTIEKALKDLIA